MSSFLLGADLLRVPGTSAYKTHEMRRGHAEDLRINGATLGDILRADDCKSSGFWMCLNQNQLELDRIVDARLKDSSGEEEWLSLGQCARLSL